MPSYIRRILLIAAAVLLIIIGYFVRLAFTPTTIPTDFREAREQSSVVSQDIVNLSNQFSSDLAQVNTLDQSGKPQDALDITTNMIQKVPDLRSKAGDLSTQLQKMAGALPQIKSDTARQAAIESITDRMALISRLFSYSDYLSQLSVVLQHHFREIPDPHSVPGIVTEINDEVTAINSFNRAASSAMDQFDTAIGAKK